MSEPLTDPAYEQSRREAEQAFYRGFKDWLQKLAEEMGRVRSERDLVWELLHWEECPGYELEKKVRELCSSYVTAELKSFAELLQRRRVPPSQVIKELEKHTAETLEETRERKWELAREQFDKLSRKFHPGSKWYGFFRYHAGEVGDVSKWTWVENAISRFLREELEPEVWFWDTVQPASAATEEGPQKPAPIEELSSGEPMRATESETTPSGDEICPDRAEARATARREFVEPILLKKGWSILDWANHSQVDFHTANDYLKGRTDPYPSTRKKLADSLGVPVPDFPK